MVSIDDLQEVVPGLFKEPIIGSLKSKMAEIRHLEIRHDVITARCYASAVYAVMQCMSVRPSRSWITPKQIKHIFKIFFTIG